MTTPRHPRLPVNEPARQWWEKGSRYYTAVITRDLFGTWCVVRTWGGKGTRLGQARTDTFRKRAMAFRHLATVARKRLRRGYRLINVQRHGDY